MLRKLLKVALLLSVVGALVLAITAGVLIVLGPPTYDYEKPEVDTSTGDAARGRRLAALMCYRCHFDGSTGSFSGRALWPEYKVFGRAYARNITKDEVLGIGELSDAQLASYLRTGVHPRHHALSAPFMPHMPNIADEDLADLLVFLRSDDPWVAPARVKDRPSQLSTRATLEAWLRWDPAPATREPVSRPPEEELIALGEYLATGLLQCHGCHSGGLGATNWTSPSKTAGFFKGGATLTDVGGHNIYGSNLTPSEAGIGEWSFEDFARGLKEGLGPDNRVLAWPMPRYPELTLIELQAMYAYFGSLPPSDKKEPKNFEYRLVPDVIDAGRRTYFEYGCQYCHPNDADGLKSLADVPERFPDDASLAAYIANPTKKDEASHRSLMPAYADIIPQERMLDLADYVRRRILVDPDAPPPIGL